MSISITAFVECDSCNFSAEYLVDDVPDAEYAWEQDDGQCVVEVRNSNGGTDYFDHMCYTCSSDLVWCAGCDDRLHYEDSYCCDEYYCEGCSIEQHQWSFDSGDRDELFEGRECIECEYVLPSPPKDTHIGKPLVTL